MFETYGIDLKEREVVAKKHDRKEVWKYLVEINAKLMHDAEGNKEQIQDCYDKLAGFYSSTGGGQAWQAMDISIDHLRYAE